MVVAGFFVWCKEGSEESEDEFCGERRRLSGDTRENGGERKVGVVNVEGHCQGRGWSLGVRDRHSQAVGKVHKFNFGRFFFSHFEFLTIPTRQSLIWTRRIFTPRICARLLEPGDTVSDYSLRTLLRPCQVAKNSEPVHLRLNASSQTRTLFARDLAPVRED